MHHMASINPYTWFVTDNAAKCPEHAADGWQVPDSRDNLVFFLVESAMRFESSVGLAPNGRVSHSHNHHEWLQYGVI